MRKVYFILFLLATQHAVGQWQYTGTKIFYDAGNVGIGYSDPIDKLHVHGSSFFFGNIRLGQEKNDPGIGSQLVFNDHGNTDPLQMARFNSAFNASELRVNLGDDGDENDRLVMGYSSYPTNTWMPKFNFLSNGKLGIGVINPTERLTVDGNLQVGDFATGFHNAGANSMIRRLLEKIEELTLHVIEMNKKVQYLDKDNETLKKAIADLLLSIKK